MLKNINILLQNVGASQLSYLVIRNANDIGAIRPEIDVIAYYENLHKNCMPPNFAVMQIAEAWGQRGPMIATTLSTAFKLIGFPADRKLFYIWELEWIREGNKQYEMYADVYTHTDLELVARSQSHKRLIESTFNREVAHVVDDFDMQQLIGILEK